MYLKIVFKIHPDSIILNNQFIKSDGEINTTEIIESNETNKII